MKNTAASSLAALREGVGSTIGGFVPVLWHAGMFSMSAVVLSGVGGIAGIWVAHRLGRG